MLHFKRVGSYVLAFDENDKTYRTTLQQRTGKWSSTNETYD